MHDSEHTVYILGAGCSVAAGYPLATNFQSELDSFRSSLGPECKYIRGSVERTLALMCRRRDTRSIDDLTYHLIEGTFDAEGTSPVERTTFQWRGVLDAKIATSAFFLHLELSSPKLGGYEDFVLQIFHAPGEWWQKVSAAKVSVLTFNYDRLFERAFLSRFPKVDETFLLYGKDVLNSGFAETTPERVAFANDKFCFLKMHGSAGMRVERWFHHLNYYVPWPRSHQPVTDELFFSQDGKFKECEPLIVFPREKQFVRHDQGCHLLHAEYLRGVWSHAQAVMANATKIWVAGYSFCSLDPELPPLLKQAKRCQEIILQNRPKDIERITSELRNRHGIKIPISAHPHDF